MANQELLKALKDYLSESLGNIVVRGVPVTLEQGVCFTVSMVASRILNGLGFGTEVARVEVALGNDIFRNLIRKHYEQGSSINSIDFEDIHAQGGHSMGLGQVPPGHQDDAKKFFHYVVIFPGEAEVMDLTFAQTSRPDYAMIHDIYWQHVESLPETIMAFNIVKDDGHARNALFYDENVLPYLNDVVENGIEKLKDYRVQS